MAFMCRGCGEYSANKSGKKEIVALVGNPNVGKSALFSRLTHKSANISNYPGTTVEIFQAPLRFDGNVEIIDTPGTYSLIPNGEDERVTRDILLNWHIDKVILVVDSKNLDRGINLAIQIAEAGLPLVVALNMFDEALSKGILIDYKKLEKILKTKVVPTVAIENKGIKELYGSLKNAKVPKIDIKYPDEIEKAVKEIEHMLPESRISRRSLALMILSGDETLKDYLRKNLKEKELRHIDEVVNTLKRKFSIPVGYIINRTRQKYADRIVSEIIKKEEIKYKTFLDKLDDYIIHPFYSLFFIFVTILFFYYFVGVFGAGVLVDLMEEKIFNGIINPKIKEIVYTVFGDGIIKDLLVGEYGIFTMALTYAFAIILPVVTTFFIAFGILEDSGYLPRLASYVNIVLKKIGLSGRAIIPLILGAGCVTMATITTRTLSTVKERLIATYLLALAIPCSAQQGVILSLIAGVGILAFGIWFGVVIIVLVLVGYMLSKIIKTGESSFYIYELPPLRVPKLSNIIIKTWTRLKWYLIEAVPIFILGTLLLFVMDKLNMLNTLYRVFEPVTVNLLGLPREAASAFILGFLRRDFGAAGFFALYEKGLLDSVQIIVSVVTITLFVPCLANLLIMIKERGVKFTLVALITIIPTAFIIGGILNILLRAFMG